MKTNYLKLLSTIAISFGSLGALCSNAWAQGHQKAHIGFIYPISSNGVKAKEISNTISLHALAGLSAGETGIAISGLATVVKGPQDGVVISGLINTISDTANGVQVAGIANIMPSNNSGVPIAGIINTSMSTNGVMVAGLTNITKEHSTTQISGLYNQTNTSDFQVAGIANTSKNSAGVQFSGLCNTANEVSTQVSGLINIAKKVEGVQIAGLINIAEKSDCPIGFINLIRNGEKQIGITYDEAGNTIIGFRSGGRRTYGIIGAGFNTRMKQARYAMEAGFGYHAAISKQFRLNLELSNTANTDFWDAAYYKSSFRILASLKLLNNIELVAGPSINYVNYLTGLNKYTEYTFYSFYGSQSTNSLFFGGTAGIHINL